MYQKRNIQICFSAMAAIALFVVSCFVNAFPAGGTEYATAYQSCFGAAAVNGVKTYGADLGIHWARLPIDVSGNNYTGINADELVQDYQNAGVIAFGVINPTAGTQSEGTAFPTAAQFAQAVGSLVERYDGDGTDDMEGLVYPIKVWELINEYSSNGMSMQYPSSFDQDAYTAMMQQGYQAIKNACPDCKLAFDPFNDDDVTALLKEFSSSNIDIISFHSYSPLDYAKDPSTDLYVGNIDTRLAKFGLTGKSVWVTEYAFYDHEGADRATGTFPGSQADNARWFVQTTGWGFGSSTFEKIIYTEIEPPLDAQSDQALAWMSLVDSDGEKKSIYYAFRKMIDMIDLYDSAEELSLGADVYGYKFFKGTRAIYLIWSRETTGSHGVTISTIKNRTATITDSVPDDSNNFTETTITASGSGLTLTIDVTPLYITVEETAPGVPAIAVSPASLDFGSIQVERSSTPAEILVSNNGSVDLTISSISFSGDNDSSFTAAPDNCSESSIPANGFCRVTVVFSPHSTGAKTALLKISSNDPASPVIDVSLTGEGISSGSDNNPDNATCPAAVLLGKDDPRLETLRSFRDEVLGKTALGREIIKLYYAGGNAAVRLCESSPFIKSAVKKALCVLSSIIENRF